MGSMFHDPQQVPEITNSIQLDVYYSFLYVQIHVEILFINYAYLEINNN